MLIRSLLAAAVSAAVPVIAHAAEAATRPNIVYILADDLGYRDIGCFGQTKIHTPNIDRMASEGIRLTNHYATPCCAPSRCVLLTGKHLGHARVRDNALAAKQKLAEEDVTFANVLQDAGYETACVGKWGLGYFNDSGNPLKHGFGHYFGYLSQTEAHRQFPEYLDVDGKRLAIEANANGRQEAYANDLFSRDALEFISAKHDKPFMLYLAYTLPHADLLVPEDSLQEYAGKFEEKPFTAKGFAAQAQPRAARAAMITRLDREVGTIIAKLKELNLDDNTLVIFTGDNGPAIAGGSDPQFFNSTGELNGVKFTLSEGGMRVPLVARWPGHIPSGATSDLVSGFDDMSPTFIELARAKLPEGLDGVSIVPALCGREAEQTKRDYLYWEYVGAQAVRMDDYKAMRPEPGRPVQLFDLKRDPGESKDIAAQHPEIVAKATEYMAAAHVDDPNWPLVKPQPPVAPKPPATRRAPASQKAPSKPKPAAKAPGV